MNAIAVDDLVRALSAAQPPLLLDVRRAAARHRSGHQIPGACEALALDD